MIVVEIQRGNEVRILVITLDDIFVGT